MSTRVCIAYEHHIFRQSLHQFLEQGGDVSVVGDASDGAEAVEAVQRHSPDLAVIDSWLADFAGVEATRRILQVRPATKVLILSTHGPVTFVEEIVRAGAFGFLSSDSSPDELFAAISALRRGQHYVSPAAAGHLFDALAKPRRNGDLTLGRLTAREREVLQLIAEGLSSKEVAAQLCLAVRTVESHRAHMMEKLEVSKVSGLVRVAIREGLIIA